MREIKFRAWYDTENRMFDWDDIKYDEYEDLNNFFDNIMADVSPLMQYTGLKDKNDVEIYEGDIILDHIGKGFVEYKKSAFRVNYNDSTCKWFLDYLESEEKTIEIIGNIYENPELIETGR